MSITSRTKATTSTTIWSRPLLKPSGRFVTVPKSKTTRSLHVSIGLKSLATPAAPTASVETLRFAPAVAPAVLLPPIETTAELTTVSTLGSVSVSRTCVVPSGSVITIRYVTVSPIVTSSIAGFNCPAPVPAKDVAETDLSTLGVIVMNSTPSLSR